MTIRATHTTMLAIAAAAAMALSMPADAQTSDPNAAPNPYGDMNPDWAKLPGGRKMGAPEGIAIDPDGKSIWIFERCGGMACNNSTLDPIMKLDPTGNTVASFGGGLFNFPHGLDVDREGNVYVTDGRSHNGKGDVMVKFSPTGQALMTLGKAGMPGSTEDRFDMPSDVAVAPNGDIYVADGHGMSFNWVPNDRVVKFSRDGKFLTTFGKYGKAPGELNTPHNIALDSAGRVFVADRINNRVSIFSADGKFVAEWKQFGRPSGLFIDKNDVLYVADNQSNASVNPGFKRGIRIGNAKDGTVTGFVPMTDEKLGASEMVAVDGQGTMFVGFTLTHAIGRLVRR
ncbi:MAG: hypothetical protein QOI12_3511 [Alphaproteobacteria bacterium]|jgi:DNA-binding beta-propeller fold protein YncE|nr:hypothetical protein [Alphaproteobacteria bacterium]